jgi:hypothetical protein
VPAPLAGFGFPPNYTRVAAAYAAIHAPAFRGAWMPSMFDLPLTLALAGTAFAPKAA